MDIAPIIQNFLAKAQYRLAKMTEEMDSYLDKGDVYFTELKYHRRELNAYYELLLPVLIIDDINDDSNWLPAAGWTDYEIVAEIEYLTSKYSLSSLPLLPRGNCAIDVIHTDGALRFLELLDTPSTYQDHRGYTVVVDTHGAGLKFESPYGIVRRQFIALHDQTDFLLPASGDIEIEEIMLITVGGVPQPNTEYTIEDVAPSHRNLVRFITPIIQDTLVVIEYFRKVYHINNPSGSSFLDLTDTPLDYTGAAGKAPVVNGTEDGLIFVDIPSPLADTDALPEGVVNLYYTEARVTANSDVAANTSARHTHSNKTLLDSLIDSGAGDKYLADDGVYKTVTGGTTVHNNLTGRDVADTHPIDSITGLTNTLARKRKGTLVKTTGALEVGKYLYIGRLYNGTSAQILGAITSEFFAPGFNLNVFHVYDTVKYEFGLTHYTPATSTQFDQLVFTQTASGNPIDIYLRISAVHTVPDYTSEITAAYSSPLSAIGLDLHGTIVSSVTNIELIVDITSKDFRATNVAPSPVTFKGLRDTPTSFLGQDKRIAHVREDLDSLEFIDHTFISTQDTPVDYVGHAGRMVVVNDTEDGLEFVDDIEMGSVEVNYRFNTTTDTTDPTSGRLKLNNADYLIATELYINEIDRNGRERNGMLAALDAGDVIVFRDNNSPDKFFTAVVLGFGVDNGDWWTIPVEVKKKGITDFNNGERGVFGAIYLGVKHFITLHDTPASYVGNAGKSAVVNAAEDGLEFLAKVGMDTAGTTTVATNLWTGTQAEYDVLGSYDDETLYFIV